MLDREYHEESELMDDELFADFVASTCLFKSVRRNAKYSPIDYMGMDKKGRICSIELKRRNFNMDRYKSIFIEPEKAWHLINRYEQYDLIPLYVNFFDDGVLMFDLRKYEKPNIELEHKKVKIYNNGHNEEQNVWRMELPTDDAIRYIREDNGEYVYVDGRKTEQGKEECTDRPS